MSGHLPAQAPRVEIEPVRGPRTPGRLVRWMRSPVAETIAEAAPDIMRLAGRAAQQTRTGPRPLADLPPAGANGLTVSEIEIAVSAPFIRRVVVRSASAWSVSPDVILAERRRRRGSRLGIGAMSLVGLTMLGVAALRRGPLSLPERPRGE